jgi:sugar lactone lactonase YvrE
MVSTSGIITTIAGIGINGYNGEGIPANKAQLSVPRGVVVSPDGNWIYIADTDNDRIRSISGKA